MLFWEFSMKQEELQRKKECRGGKEKKESKIRWRVVREEEEEREIEDGGWPRRGLLPGSQGSNRTQ
jgi:hypothetical protein